MAGNGGDIDGVKENGVEDGMKHASELIDTNGAVETDNSNTLGDGNKDHDCSPEELEKMVLELNFQNEFMKSQFESLKDHIKESDMPDMRNKSMEHDSLGSQHELKQLQEKVESLNRELVEERLTRAAAEGALKHLQDANAEADVKAQELSATLAEGCNPFFTLIVYAIDGCRFL